MTLMEAPRPDCTKCGDPGGFWKVEPEYLPSPFVPFGGGTVDDALQWTCRRCGYTFTTPVADAVVEHRAAT